MKKVRVKVGYIIELPRETRDFFKEGDDLFLSVRENTLRLKKLNRSTLLDRVEHAVENGKPPRLREINRIVHEMRKQDSV